MVAKNDLTHKVKGHIELACMLSRLTDISVTSDLSHMCSIIPIPALSECLKGMSCVQEAVQSKALPEEASKGP